MKTRYIIIFFLGLFSLASDVFAQKDHLTITVENLPVKYTWSRDTVDSQGKSTGSSNGSENVLLTVSPDVSENYSSFARSGDTTVFTGTNSLTTIIFDNSLHIVKKIDYLYYYSPAQSITYNVEFRAKDIPAVDVDTAFVVDLTGADILGHDLYYSSDLRWGPIDGPGEYGDDNYVSLGTSDPTAHIRISISKQHLLGVQKEHSQTSALAIFPNPASRIVNIRHAETDAASEVTVSDMLGRTISTFSAYANSDVLSFDVASLPPGIYWLRAGGEMRKFVIAR
jgi:hypothetical protein